MCHIEKINRNSDSDLGLKGRDVIFWKDRPPLPSAKDTLDCTCEMPCRQQNQIPVPAKPAAAHGHRNNCR